MLLVALGQVGTKELTFKRSVLNNMYTLLNIPTLNKTAVKMQLSCVLQRLNSLTVSINDHK